MSKKKKLDLFKNLVLDEYEQELEEELKKGNFKRVKNFEREKKELEEAAKRHIELRKSKRITLRVNNEDLIKVKARAKRARIPYQRLIGSLIHKFADVQTKVEV
ncbi:MAG: hypothetical protein AAB907_03905 [Patescibacteria group bacterium]|mgnify:CR=1 FL=1